MKSASSPTRGRPACGVPPLPQISYRQALRSWFVYQGQPYNVESCPQQVFVAWVRTLTTRWKAEKRMALLALENSQDDRLLGRWYTLCELRQSKGQGLQLYDSEQETRDGLDTHTSTDRAGKSETQSDASGSPGPARTIPGDQRRESSTEV